MGHSSDTRRLSVTAMCYSHQHSRDACIDLHVENRGKEFETQTFTNNAKARYRLTDRLLTQGYPLSIPLEKVIWMLLNK